MSVRLIHIGSSRHDRSCGLQFSLRLLFATIFGVVLISPAQSQWQALKTFPQQVRSIAFLDKVGAPSTGFVGLVDGEIWRTTDGGQSWLQSKTPLPNLIGIPVSSFTFKDQNVGWAGVSANSNYNGVWQTTDGGLNWTRLTSISGNIVSVGYSPQTDRLFAISWTGLAKVSTDGGATWLGFAPMNQNGVWFEGSRGVISNLRSQTLLFTTDGGLSWSPSTPALPTECWSPWAFPNTNVFVAVSEKSREFFVSTDAGQSWNVRHLFASSVVPRGCVMGSGSDVFVQTNQGFFVSHDTGVTWFSICGPSNDLDTRFYVKGAELFAGELGPTLWYNANAGAASLAQFGFSSQRYSASASRCSSSDSTFVFRINPSCSTVLTSIDLIQGAPQFQISVGALPRVLSGTSDSIAVHYEPGSTTKDSAVLLLRFTVSGRTFDTLVTLYGTARRGVSIIDMPTSLAIKLPSACSTIDTSVAIHNIGCDSVTVLSAAIDDPVHFVLKSDPLPRVVAQGQYFAMHVDAEAEVSGDFFTDVRLHLRMGVREFDTIIAVSMKVLSAKKPILPSVSVQLTNHCQTLDTSFAIINPSCDSIRIVDVRCADTSVFHMLTIRTPVVVHAGDSLNVLVNAWAPGKGTYGANVLVSYLDAENNRHDTSLTLHLIVVNALPVVAGLSSSLLDLGSVNAPCASATRNIRVWNTQCGLTRIVGVRWAQSVPDFAVNTPKLPFVLGSTDTAEISVSFAPTALGKRAELLFITLDVDGQQHDTAITITGTGQSTFTASVPASAVQFDSLLLCESSLRTIPVINASCDRIQITEASIGADNGFSMVDAHLPILVDAGDTALLRVALRPSHAGLIKDSIEIRMHEVSDPSVQIRTVGVTAFVKEASRIAKIDAADIQILSLDPCASKDTSILIRNGSPCEDLDITDITVSGASGVSISPYIGLPLQLRPSDSVVIPIRIGDLSDTLQTAFIRLHGSWVDTIVTLNMRTATSGRHVLLADGDSVLATRPCIAVASTRWLINDGCKPVVVDSVVLSGLTGQTQLSASVSRQLPFVLDPNDSASIDLKFDPDGEGDGNADLRIVSAQGSLDRTLHLSGEVRGTAPVLRLGTQVVSVDNTISAHAGESFAVSLMAFDEIGDSSGLNTLEGVLHFNPDLLICRGVTAASGWDLITARGAEIGVLSLQLERQAGVATNGELAQVRFEPRVADSTATDIHLTDVRLNADDPTFERCMLSSIVSAPTVRFVVSDSCGTRLMRDKLRGVPILDLVGISPNPAERGSAVQVTVYTTNSDKLMVRLISSTGEVLKSIEVAAASGLNTFDLPIVGIPSGPTVIVVSSDLETRSRKLVIR